MCGEGFGSLAALDQPGSAVTIRGPEAASFPPGVRVIDTAVEALGVEAQGIGHAERYHAAILQRDQTVVEISGRHGDILAEAERVVLVDPTVVAGLRAVFADALETRSWILIESPAFRTVIAGGLRSVEWALALAAIEASKVTAGERHPHDTFLVDIGATWAEPRHWYVIYLGQGCLWRVRAGNQPNDCTRIVPV